jgi:Undecaprenyl-phosphate glucose phosphotransferase
LSQIGAAADAPIAAFGFALLRGSPMNTVQSYTLACRPQTSRFLRRWALLSHGAFSSLLFLLDVTLIVAVSCVTGIAYYFSTTGAYGEISPFVQVGALAAGIFATSNVSRGEYRMTNFFAFRPLIGRTVHLWNVTLICILTLWFLAQASTQYSRAWLVLFYAVTLAALLIERFLIVRITKHARRAGLISAQRIFLIGGGALVNDFIESYDLRALGVSIVGCRFLTPVAADAMVEERNAALNRDLTAAISSVRQLEPDAIFLLLPWSANDTIARCVDAFLALPVAIHLGPELILQKFVNVELSRLGPMASLQLTRLPLSRLEVAEKRLFDVFLSGAALLALTPFLILIGLLIRMDSKGPVFFVQRRYGFNQQPFRIIKFRTMSTLDDGPVVPQAVRNDPRVTRMGSWLRRWNIDEIPQLFNVLTGDMSLVGPRPHALSHDREYERRISLYARRHNVKPGITGWAQINGFRGVTDTEDKMRKRVEYDLFYIDNWSLWLDLKIIARTVLSSTAYRNAY